MASILNCSPKQKSDSILYGGVVQSQQIQSFMSDFYVTPSRFQDDPSLQLAGPLRRASGAEKLHARCDFQVTGDGDGCVIRVWVWIEVPSSKQQGHGTSIMNVYISFQQRIMDFQRAMSV